MSTDEDHTPSLLAGPIRSPSTRILSCLRCQQRKVRCDKKEPCSSCVKAGVECTSLSSLPPRRRKKRFPEAELLARLTHYEELLRGFGVNFDSIKTDGGLVPLESGRDNSRGDRTTKQATDKGETLSGEKNSWSGIKDEFRDIEELLEGSSEDELIEAPITTTWATMGTDNAAFLLFGSQHKPTQLTSFHPQPMEIMRLWQIFLDNVNPLTKVIHAPSLQQQIIEGSIKLGAISRSMEALLFSIYTLSITSLDDVHCKNIFGEDKSFLLERYQFAAQQALLNAEFLRPSSLMVLQALLLYLISVRKRIDPRSLSCVTSITLRLAQHMGLHRDGQDQHLPPFDVEMRRRLWWQIVLFDSRIAEFSGLGTSIHNHQWTTRLPLNVNDSDLYPSMKEAPAEHIRITEMLFCLTRCEVAEFLRRVRASTMYDGCWHELSTSHMPLAAKDKEIDELQRLLESKYLRFCDASIPLHLVSSSMTKSAICKLRHIAHHPRLLADRGANRSQDEKDRFFSWSVEMIEHSNRPHADKSTQRFAWHIVVNKPLHGYIHVLSELRQRTTGDLAERAWRHIIECFNHWFILKSLVDEQRYSALFLALANLAVKAWEARASALSQSQPFVLPPDVILQLQAYLDSWRLSKSTGATDWSPLENSKGFLIGERCKKNTNLLETNNQMDISMPIDLPPLEDPLDWVYWNELALEFPAPGMENGGSNDFHQA